MRVAVNSHALPIYKKNRIASLLCIFETIIQLFFDKTTPHFQLLPMSKIHQTKLRIHEAPPLQ